ncbi:MAG: dicarboxylate/amino acid:cation symporter [Bacteroidaceae bacterium]
MKKTILWSGALLLGAFIGTLNAFSGSTAFVATVYTRLFQFLAVPTIALAVTTTLASLGQKQGMGGIFRRTVTLTLLTTVCAAVVGLALARLLRDKENVGVVTLHRCLLGLQDLFYMLINALVWTLPLGIVAFAAQLSAQVSAGIIVGSLGKYVVVILAGNFLQTFVVLPLFLLAGGISPLRAFRAMMPAVLMALFTKSSAATLPVTIRSAESNMQVPPLVSRFVLPICTTINMNGCATFILVTSLYVMQNGGMHFSAPVLLLWVLVAVLSAVGNAGVPMGCYFLTLSLMSSVEGAPIGIMGVILPIFTIIDMVETAENVWSDSCVCALVARSEGGGTE